MPHFVFAQKLEKECEEEQKQECLGLENGSDYQVLILKFASHKEERHIPDSMCI